MYFLHSIHIDLVLDYSNNSINQTKYILLNL